MAELVVGGVPRGDDYFGQGEFIDGLWGKLARDSVLLVAPRRFGKTAAMFRLLDAPRAGFQPLYLNVEHIVDPASFTVELLSLLLRHRPFARVVCRLWEGVKDVRDWIRELPESVDAGGIKVELRARTDVSANWLSYAERLLAMLANEEPQLLLLVDEFPVMVTEMLGREGHEAKRFLRWFRTARTAPGTRTRFVLGGSTNIVYCLEGAGLVDTINDLNPVKLRPFGARTAAEFLDAVFATRGIPLPPDVRSRILELVGAPIPYLLALLVQFVFERAQAERRDPTPAMVDGAFSDDLLGGGPSVFLHYWSRLRQHYPSPEDTAAKAMLGVLSRAEGTVKRDTLYQVYIRACQRGGTTGGDEAFVRLMWKLDNDFYVMSNDHGYAFFSRVLKLWWCRCYGDQET